MNKEWLKKVNMSIEESDDLQMWCENIGYERYEKIYNLVYRVIGEDFVNYKELRAIAKYDFSLSDILHSMMKLVELRFRSYLINHYITIEVIVQSLGKDRRTITRNIGVLREKQLLRRVGSDKTGYWEIIE